MCQCKICSNIIFLNRNKESRAIMADNTSDTSNESLKINLKPLMTVFQLGYTLVKYVGLMFVGLVIGAGIVIKNPPQDTVLVKKLRALEEENNNLKIKLTQPEFVTKESVVIK